MRGNVKAMKFLNLQQKIKLKILFIKMKKIVRKEINISKQVSIDFTAKLQLPRFFKAMFDQVMRIDKIQKYQTAAL